MPKAGRWGPSSVQQAPGTAVNRGGTRGHGKAQAASPGQASWGAGPTVGGGPSFLMGFWRVNQVRLTFFY